MPPNGSSLTRNRCLEGIETDEQRFTRELEERVVEGDLTTYCVCEDYDWFS